MQRRGTIATATDYVHVPDGLPAIYALSAAQAHSWSRLDSILAHQLLVSGTYAHWVPLMLTPGAADTLRTSHLLIHALMPGGGQPNHVAEMANPHLIQLARGARIAQRQV